MRRAQLYTGQQCEDHTKGLQPGQPEPQFNAQMREMVSWCTLLNEFDYTCMSPQVFDYKINKSFMSGMDEFYKEPLNTRLPPEYAMEYVRDKLTRKKTAGQLLDELNEWREIVNRHSQ